MPSPHTLIVQLVRAVVGVDHVAVVALLAGIEHAVAAADAVLAVVLAAAGRVAVVADLAEVLDAVAAGLVRLAVELAAVGRAHADGAVRIRVADVAVAARAVVGVAVVAGLADVGDAVAALLERLAVGGAAVAVDRVAVVADLAGVGVVTPSPHASADLQSAEQPSPFDDVAVVAGLAGVDDAVAAVLLMQTGWTAAHCVPIGTEMPLAHSCARRARRARAATRTATPAMQDQSLHSRTSP